MLVRPLGPQTRSQTAHLRFVDHTFFLPLLLLLLLLLLSLSSFSFTSSTMLILTMPFFLLRMTGRSHLVPLSIPPVTHMYTRSSRTSPIPPTTSAPPPLMVSVPTMIQHPPGPIPGTRPPVSIGSRGHPIPVFQA